MDPVIIIGAGQAGARAAFSLRDAGWAHGIVLLGDEEYPPYERPPLSKEVLHGLAEGPDAQVADMLAYEEAEIMLRLDARVRKVDTHDQLVWLSSGEEIGFSKLIFATGARARPLDIPGIELDGIFSVRDVRDAHALRAAMRDSTRMAIIGGGFVGLEVAAAARKQGNEAVVIEQESACLGRVLPAEAVEPIIAEHLAHGVDIRCGTGVAAIEGRNRVEHVRLVDGAVIDADLVIVGIGSIANDELARDAGIACNNGIAVDEQCRTSIPSVYAIGDVASRIDLPSGRALRLESWENAERQAVSVANTIMSGTCLYHDAPWFWTDQYNLNVQIVGNAQQDDTLVTRAQNGQSIQFYLRDGLLACGVMFNSGREKRSIVRLIGRRLDATQLADPTVPLKQLVKTASD